MHHNDMGDPIDGKPFWVTHDQLERERRKAELVQTQLNLALQSLECINRVSAVLGPDDQVAEWHSRVIELKRLASTAIEAAELHRIGFD